MCPPSRDRIPDLMPMTRQRISSKHAVSESTYTMIGGSEITPTVAIKTVGGAVMVWIPLIHTVGNLVDQCAIFDDWHSAESFQI